MAHILVVDDEARIRHLLSIMLEQKGFRVDQADDGMVALEMVRSTPYDIVVTDIKMPRMDGNSLLNKIKEENIACPVVFITAFATVDSAVEVMRRGAADYITKPFEEARIMEAVERTLNLSRVMAENRYLRKELAQVVGPDHIVHLSTEMQQIMRLAMQVAESDAAVLITGESGTGKELLARYIHTTSKRARERFVPVNCAAISPNLVESELFGHEKGAFTGADRRTKGKFEYASGGTLFLDEIGDLPLEVQAKLLRALQEKKVQRVGGNDEIPVDVRVICATNRDLQELVANNGFRQDLYFRINVFPLEPPPLRHRKGDIVPLAEHFLERFCRGGQTTLTDGAKRVLMEYHWPGNVRELMNAIERAMILAGERGAVTAETLSFLRPMQKTCVSGMSFELPPEGLSLEALETDLVRQALEAAAGNQSTAAKLLGLTRAKFRVLMKRN